jgi:DNA-binding NarL/FixJ family response regulator
MAALQEKAEAQPVRASAYPNGLTQREIEVIQLVAAGKMARETGEELGNRGAKT